MNPIRFLIMVLSCILWFSDFMLHYEIFSAGNSGAAGQTIWNIIFGSTLTSSVVTGSSGTGSGSTSVANYFINVTIELGDLGNARFF